MVFLECLLDHGADVNASGGFYGTPLGFAVHYRNLEVVERLLRAGANIRAPAGPFSLLEIAIKKDNHAIFRLFLSRGADVNVIGEHNTTPLGVAAAGNHMEMFSELLEHGAEASLNQSSALAEAAENGNNRAIEILLEYGADPHEQQGVSGLALHLAARQGFLSTVKLLLSKQVDVNAYNRDHGFVHTLSPQKPYHQLTI
jgi:ankyrin repeat protein